MFSCKVSIPRSGDSGLDCATGDSRAEGPETPVLTTIPFFFFFFFFFFSFFFSYSLFSLPWV
jgi:hypothetical protein